MIYDDAARNVAGQLGQGSVLGIVGGRTTEGFLRALTAQELPDIHVFWLDERIAGEKNFVQALPFLEQLPVEWHPLTSTTVPAAREEMEALSEKLEALGGFDVVVLSAGEDGHIASLFPGREELHATVPGYVLVENAPKPPPERVTVTPPLLQADAHLFFVGRGKKTAYDRYLDPSVNVEDCPAKLLRSPTVYTEF